MARELFITDDDVEREIERLKRSELVALAKKEEAIRNRRRQYMYQLRSYEKKGQQLADAGYTLENIEELFDE